MKYFEIVEAIQPVKTISPQEAKDRNMFGPVYHGTTGDINDIIKTGFNPKYSVHGGGKLGVRNGMTMDPYGFTGIAAPCHWLGWGTYFTTVKAIAKQFNGETTKNLKTFYIDTQNILEINFGSPNTMMKWWFQNGYDMTAEATKRHDIKAWIKATGKLTRNLRQQYDAVHFLGKGIRKLLDGDQLCVYKPSLIYVVDTKLASKETLEIGSIVKHTQIPPKRLMQGKWSNNFYIDDIKPTDKAYSNLVGWKGVFRNTDHNGNDAKRDNEIAIHLIPPPDMTGTIVNIRKHPDGNMYEVKWKKGGTHYNYGPEELIPV